MRLSTCFKIELEAKAKDKFLEDADLIKKERGCPIEEAIATLLAGGVDGADEEDFAVEFPFRNEIFCHVFGTIPVLSFVETLEQYGNFSFIWASTDCEGYDVEDLFEGDKADLGDYEQDCCGHYIKYNEGYSDFSIAKTEEAKRVLLINAWEDQFSGYPDAPECCPETDSFLVEYDEEDWEASAEYFEYDDYEEYFESNYEYLSVESALGIASEIDFRAQGAS